MKIGILTFHRAHNYGAILQAYAMQTYLQKLGHQVYVIDYAPRYLTDSYRWLVLYYWFSINPLKLIRKLITEPRLVVKRKKRYDRFNRFITEHLNLYPYDDKNNFADFDCIVVGSDQIWEPKHTGGRFDPIFFGHGMKCHVISYAASSQLGNLGESNMNELSAYLDRLDAISVREKSQRDIIAQLCNKTVEVVLDPTFIVEGSVFSDLTAKQDLGDYVCIYEIGPHPETWAVAEHIAGQIGARVIEVAARVREKNNPSVIETASIEEFLGLISNAKCLITTSFHGTALAIKNHINFYALRVNSGNDERIENILKTCGIEDRFVSLNSRPSFSAIDYATVDKRLSELVVHSHNYIIKALNIIKDTEKV